MKVTSKKSIALIIIFTLIYGFYVTQVDMLSENFSTIASASTFFFALFTGFFINRQNQRYSSVSDLISKTDGYFSFLYRITQDIPQVQNKIRNVLKDHYDKIIKSGDWAYHVHNPSNTITELTVAISDIKDSDIKNKVVEGYLYATPKVLSDLQVSRKQMVSILGEKLLPLHWGIVIVLGIVVLISIGSFPSENIQTEILKVLFGTSVFISFLLLIQLDHLTIFGDNAAENTAGDLFKIINEEDKKNLSKE